MSHLPTRSPVHRTNRTARSADFNFSRGLEVNRRFERRVSPDRRYFSYTAHAPERRSGFDRRRSRRRETQGKVA